MRTCRNDFLRSRRTAWLWPAAFGTVAAGWLVLPPTAGALVAAGGFAVAGALCVANAVHCRRTHCVATGPIYLVAAVLFVTRAAGADMPAGWIVVGAALGTVLAYTPEWLGRPYLRRGGERGDAA
jgi:hypothetical protein